MCQYWLRENDVQVKIIVSLAGCSISTYNIAKGQLWFMELWPIFIVLPTVAIGFDEIALTKGMAAISHNICNPCTHD